MLVFLSSVAVLVAVNVVTRRAQRDEEGFDPIPALRFPE